MCSLQFALNKSCIFFIYGICYHMLDLIGRITMPSMEITFAIPTKVKNAGVWVICYIIFL